MKLLIVNSPSEIGLDIQDHFKELNFVVTYKATTEIPPMRQSGIMTTGAPMYTPNALECVRKLCKPLEYHFVIYCYNPSDYPQNGTTGGFTEYSHAWIGTPIATVRLDGNQILYAVHEMMHMFVQKLNRLGFKVNDVMDLTPVNGKMIPYYKNWPPSWSDADSNHSQTWVNIYPYIKYLDEMPPIMKKGSKGPWVRDLQISLLASGAWFLGTDGTFGSFTESAVRSFQKKKGLTVDGIVGPKTLEAFKIN